jgi:RiboL-PSP-HEPN
MGSRAKSSAREAFDLNMADAEMLVELAKLLNNRRTRRMRLELRERLGTAFGIAKRRWPEMECLENDRIFVIFKPGHAHWRGQLESQNLSPLLRQALVAACAAIETFCADRVMELYSTARKSNPPPSRLLALTMSVENYITIEERYERRSWGLRQVVELEVRKRASPAPAQIGELFGIVGQKNLLNRIDARRGLPKGTSTQALEKIVERRNLIAHTGDRKGRGRATISVAEVEEDLKTVASIISALDEETSVPVNSVRQSAVNSRGAIAEPTVSTT